MWAIKAWLVTFIGLVAYFILKEPILKIISKFYKRYYSALNFFKNQKYNQALEEMKRAKDINPNKSIVYNGLGSIYLIKGENKEAIKCFEKSLVIKKKKNYEAIALLAYLYMEENINKKDPLSLICKVINLVKEKDTIKWKYEKSFFYDIKSWILFKQKKEDDSINYSDKVLRHIDNLYETEYNIEHMAYIVIIFYHLGIISKHMGKYDEAKEWFKKSIKAGGPESVFSKRSKEELKELQKG